VRYAHVTLHECGGFYVLETVCGASAGALSMETIVGSSLKDLWEAVHASEATTKEDHVAKLGRARATGLTQVEALVGERADGAMAALQLALERSAAAREAYLAACLRRTAPHSARRSDDPSAQVRPAILSRQARGE